MPELVSCDGKLLRYFEAYHGHHWQSSQERFEGHNCFLDAAFDQRAHMVGPHRQCGAHFALVTAAIVDPGDAAFVATLMVEHGFDNVRLDSDVGHFGGDRAPDVAQLPARHPRASIKVLLVKVPGLKAGGAALTKQPFTADH